MRLLQVGAGGMGRAWLRAVAASPDAEMVGLVDLDLDAARAAAAAVGSPNLPVARSLSELFERTRPDAVLNVTVPEAHVAVTLEAVFAGLPVLGEKPAAPTVADALVMVAAARATGQLVMISQSRRYYPELRRFRTQVGTLGRLGTLSCRFFKSVHFGGFREEMEHPLLVDMAIHHLDQARYLTGANPVRVSCTAYNPPWSWFRGAASAQVDVELDSGAHLAYSGSWVAAGAETSWNGDWFVSGERGTGSWDGTGEPRRELADVTEQETDGRTGGGSEGPGTGAGESGGARSDGAGSDGRGSDGRGSDGRETGGRGAACGGAGCGGKGGEAREIAGSLAEFVGCLRAGTTPDTEVAANVWSLAMVEAAVRSAEEFRPVFVADLLQQAHVTAMARPTRPEIHRVLADANPVG